MIVVVVKYLRLHMAEGKFVLVHTVYVMQVDSAFRAKMHHIVPVKTINLLTGLRSSNME